MPLPAWLNPAATPVDFAIFCACVAFFLAIMGGEWITDALTTLALAMKMEPMIVGIVIANIMGIVPIVTIIAMLGVHGCPETAVGATLGGSWLIMIVPIAVAGINMPTSVRPSWITTDLPILVIFFIAFVFFASGGEMTLTHGLWLVGMAAAYFILKYTHGQEGRYGLNAFGKNFIFGSSIVNTLGKLALGVVFLLAAGWYLGLTARAATTAWGIPALPLGFTLAIPFCLTELNFALAAIKRGQGEVVIGRGLWMGILITAIGGAALGVFHLKFDGNLLNFLPLAFVVLLIVLWLFLRGSDRLWPWQATILLLITLRHS
jgi:Ca2+/Na+ antiporter